MKKHTKKPQKQDYQTKRKNEVHKDIKRHRKIVQRKEKNNKKERAAIIKLIFAPSQE